MKPLSFRLLISGLLLAVVHVFFNQALHAQTVKFKHLSIEEGLSQLKVNCIFQDKQGLMWFGTQDGLNYYDGYTFKSFRHDPTDSTSLSNNVILSIYEDKKGRLWIGTRFGGLNLFDPKTETFKAYKHNPANPSSLSNNMINALWEDHNGRLLVGADFGGLNLFNPESETFERLTFEAKNHKSISNERVLSIYEDNAGRFWIGTYGGLNLFDPAEKTFQRFVHNPDHTNSLSHNWVYYIKEDSRGQLWVATYDGLNLFNPVDKNFKRYANGGASGSNWFTCLYEDTEQQLWIGTHATGLRIFDPESNTIKVYLNDPHDPGTVSSNWIQAIYEDRSGRVWMATQNGIDIYDAQELQFTTFKNEPSDAKSLSNNAVLSIYQDAADQIWIGTWSGLNLFDKDNGTFKRYTINPNSALAAESNCIFALYQDSKSQLWIGTNEAGLFHFNPSTNSFVNYKHNPRDTTSLSIDVVASFHEYDQNTLWVGTFTGGVNLFNQKTKKFQRYQNNPENKTSLSQNTVRVIYRNRSGQLWLGTHGGGLNLFDPETKSFKHFKHNSKDTTSLSSNVVRAIYEDKQGRLWIGTADGLNLFDAKTQTFKTIKEKQGLPNSSITSIQEDEAGRLWIFTYRGLSRYTPATNELIQQGIWGDFRTYDQTDGLPGTELEVSCKGRDGTIYFGGANGFAVFHPDNMKDNDYVPPVILSGFEIFNKRVLPGKEVNNFTLPFSISQTDELTLSHNESVFTIEFAALSYFQSEKNKYAYKLTGFDKDWNYTDANRRFATYTNLDPGTYTFQVRASNNDGVWNNEGRTLKIIITPPWWNTWWFQLLSITGALGLVAFAYFLRTENIRRTNKALATIVEQKTKELKKANLVLADQREELALQNEKLKQSKEEIAAQRDVVSQQNNILSTQREELAAQNHELNTLNIEKNNLIGIVAHDLKTPLNQIKGLIGLIREAPGLANKENAEYIAMINDSAKRLTSMIDKILNVEAIEARQHNLHMERIDYADLVHTVVKRHVLEAGAKQIKFSESLEDGVFIYVDRAYTDQILENLLSNAIKFSPNERTIYVSIVATDDFAVCEIRDEGPGLHEYEKDKLFKKYQKLSATPTGNESSTGLGLSIVKKFVDAMDGKIWCESEIGKGASFFVQFKTVKKDGI
jgi:ligand-binding sensor domain-containing protein/anti-sigma regulatory factor (Ser/Thr protein kinase)